MARVCESAIDQNVSESDSLEKLASELAGCTKCKLAQNRTHVLVGGGVGSEKVMFVAEAPTEFEDQEARTWVGPAAELLEKLLVEAGLSKTEIFYSHLVKCKTPGGRMPEPDEIAACGPFFRRQLELISPKIIVTLGKFASQTLLQNDAPMNELREKTYTLEGRKLMATFHPAYLLKSQASHSDARDDFKKAAQEVE